MKRKVKSARQILVVPLLGLLLCFFVQMVVFAYNEADITKLETTTQTEASGSADPSDETEIYSQPKDVTQVETTETTTENDTEELFEASLNEEGLDDENEANLMEINPLLAMKPLLMQAEVHNLTELQDWLDINPMGGTVTLGENIEITGTLALSQVRIMAGDFGFIVNGTLTLDGDVDITGSGITPLVCIDAGGNLDIYGENSITATGPCGTAVFFAAGGNYINSISARPFIYAEGTGSVAIKSEIPLNLERFTIRAANGGELIESSEPVRLYLSYVEASEVIVLPSNITLDTCVVSSNISGGTVINRKITTVKPSFPFLLYRSEEATGYFDNLNVRCFITLSAEGVEDESEQVYIRFDDSAIDFDTPGEHLLPGTLLPPYDDLYAFGIVPQSKPLATVLTIYDPIIPFFYGSYRDPMMFAVEYYYIGDLDELTLWRSDDDGDSWRVYWQSGEGESESFLIDYNGYNLSLLFFDSAELSAPTLFVFEVGEDVGSDILYIDITTVKSVGQGGDRDSGDRILLPWEFFLGNPDEDDEENGGTGGTNPPQNKVDETDNQGTDDSNDADDIKGNDNQSISTGNQLAEDSLGDKANASSNLAEDGVLAIQSDTEQAMHTPQGLGEAITSAAAYAKAPILTETAPFAVSGNMAADISVPNEAKPSLEEYENETTIAISGKRFKALMSVNPQMVPFAREGIHVWVSDSFFSELSLADNDVFTVTIEKPTQTSVSVLFYINGQALDKPFEKPFLAGIPWEKTNAEIFCTDSSGKEIPFEYNGQNGLLILTLYECGTYTIDTKLGEAGITSNVDNTDNHIGGNTAKAVLERVSKQTPVSSPFFPILAAGTAGIGGAGGLAYAFRKRRVKGI